MPLTLQPKTLIAGSVAILVVGLIWWYLSGRGPTPVTVGEGSIVIISDPGQPFFADWLIDDGAPDWAHSKRITVNAKHQGKSWRKIKVKPKGGQFGDVDDCEKTDGCEIVAEYSDGTKVTLSGLTKNTGMRIASDRVLGDYDLTNTSSESRLESKDKTITCVKVTLTKVGTPGVSLCSHCQVQVEYR